MRRSTLNFLSGLTFLIVIVIALFLAWFNVKNKYPAKTTVDYQTINISSSKAQARSLITGAENNGNLPLEVPTVKMGKTNPFSNIETE